MRRNQPYQERRAELCREKEGYVQNFKVGNLWIILGSERLGSGAQDDAKLKEDYLEERFELQIEARSHTGQSKECELESKDYHNL